jgi:hypothetical protein
MSRKKRKLIKQILGNVKGTKLVKKAFLSSLPSSLSVA